MPIRIQLPPGWQALNEPSQGVAMGAGPIEGGQAQLQIFAIPGPNEAALHQQQVIQLNERVGAKVRMIENRPRRTASGASLISLVYDASDDLATMRFEVCFYPAQQYSIAVAFGAAPSVFDNAAVLRDSLFRDRVQVP
jgi:hypothetical protein